METGQGPQGQKEGAPAILIVTNTGHGHVIPLLQIAGYLAGRGYDVWVLSQPEHREAAEKTGVRFLEASPPWWAACPAAETVRALQDALASASRDEKWASISNAMYRHAMTGRVRSQLESLRRAMAAVRQGSVAAARAGVVIVADTFFHGVLPLKLGAALPEGYERVPRTLGISPVPPLLATVEHGPPLIGAMATGLSGSLGLPHDRELASTEAVRARNALLARLHCALHEPTWEELRGVLRACGARDDYAPLLAGASVAQAPSALPFLCHDATLQMCTPSLEFPARWPDRVRFGGALPPKAVDPDLVYPDWFTRLERGTSKKRRIVLATQGTLATQYAACVVPTIRGLAGRDDVLVVATLGARGATLDEHFPGDQLPGNAVVVDYFPYRPLLELADVVVTNGSYGIFSQCAVHGVPMVLAGSVSEDKPEVCRRVEYAGLGININVALPSPSQISAAVDEVLGNKAFRTRAREIQQEAQEFKCLETVERELRKMF